MNPDYYTSFVIAKKLGSLFPKSEKVWVRYRRKKDYQWNPWFICTRIEHLDFIKLQGTPKQHYEIFPAPSLMEIMDELPGYSVWVEAKYNNTEQVLTWYCLENNSNPPNCIEASTAPDVAALMLLQVRENN